MQAPQGRLGRPPSAAGGRQPPESLRRAPPHIPLGRLRDAPMNLSWQVVKSGSEERAAEYALATRSGMRAMGPPPTPAPPPVERLGAEAECGGPAAGAPRAMKLCECCCSWKWGVAVGPPRAISSSAGVQLRQVGVGVGKGYYQGEASPRMKDTLASAQHSSFRPKADLTRAGSAPKANRRPKHALCAAVQARPPGLALTRGWAGRLSC